MREPRVCGQPDVLYVFSLLCRWPRIYIEHVQIPFCDEKDLLKYQVVMVGHHQTPTVVGGKGKICISCFSSAKIAVGAH